MDLNFVRRWIAQIQAQLLQVNVTTKLAFGVCVILLCMALFLVFTYAGKQEMVSLFGNVAVNPQQLSSIPPMLRLRGIDTEVEAGRILVPKEKQVEAFAVVAEQQLLPNDMSGGFHSIIERQNWWLSDKQNDQAWLVALQSILSKTVSELPGVSRATVIISMPKNMGFGRRLKRPSASVNMVMTGGSVDQKLTDAVAGLVSGAVAEMESKDVVVIDATAGRQFRVRDDEGGVDASTYLEMVQTQERLYRDKVADALRYIPNVIVAVHVEVNMQRKNSSKTVYNEKESVYLPKSSESRSSNTTDAGRGGEPGVGSNTGVDIRMGGGGGRTSTDEETNEAFDPYPGVEVVQLYQPSGLPERISATVNVPRSYFVNIYNRGKGDSATVPTDEELTDTVNEQLDNIKRQVVPLLTSQLAGQVVVHMYPDDEILTGGVGGAQATRVGGGGIMGVMGGDMVKTIGLGALATISLMMMLMVMRKAATAPKLPTAEELAGLPPTLDSNEEMMGDVDELDSALEGMELDEGQVRSRKLSQQVGDMVKSNPCEAANLVSRWVNESE